MMQNAGEKVNESPYMAARREWNERYGSFVKLAEQWRMVALGSTVGFIIAVAGLVAVSLQQKVVPYAVELNGHSEVVRVTRADVMSHPTANQVRAALRSWIIGARTVYADRRAQQAQIDSTYSMTVPESAAYQTLATYHRENNPYQRSQKETVEITVNAVVAVSDETWQVEWTEVTKQLSGRVMDTKAWQGSFTVVIDPPVDDAQILVNPLGVYVRQFAWTTRI